MAYSTLTDWKKVIPEANLVQLTDDEDIGAVNGDRVSELIVQADSIIDGYLRGRYTVPLTDVPEMIKRGSCEIGIYFAYQRTMEDIPETRLLAYKDTIRFLERVSSGKMSLPIDEGMDDGFAMGSLRTSHFGTAEDDE